MEPVPMDRQKITQSAGSDERFAKEGQIGSSVGPSVQDRVHPVFQTEFLQPGTDPPRLLPQVEQVIEPPQGERRQLEKLHVEGRWWHVDRHKADISRGLPVMLGGEKQALFLDSGGVPRDIEIFGNCVVAKTTEGKELHQTKKAVPASILAETAL